VSVTYLIRVEESLRAAGEEEDRVRQLVIVLLAALEDFQFLFQSVPEEGNNLEET